MLLSGILPPITTPFYRDGQVYYKKLEHNVERYSRSPVAGIMVLGSAGEPLMLSDDEKRSVLKCALESAAPEKVMIAGTGAESAIETLRLTDYAATLGYDVAIVRTPHYYKKQMQPLNMLSFYRFVADRSPLPVVIYNAPHTTGYDIPADVVAELAEHPNVIGIKESSGSLEKLRTIAGRTLHIHRAVTVTERFEPVTGRMLKAAAAGSEVALVPAEALVASSSANAKPSSTAVRVIGKLKTRQKDAGFQIMIGSAQQLHESFQAGATGASLPFAGAAPGACFEIYAAFRDGDIPLTEQKQQRITKAAARIVGELGIPGLKYAMDLNGYYGGNGRLPLLPLDAETKLEIERLMADIRS
ncbi:MAG: dihydrodipicolinate synthase family protein [Candidatus Korobacteraceae bacterium]|jgi:dihydrodipicolinate synthase/N-acetylneuraminate lyase